MPFGFQVRHVEVFAVMKQAFTYRILYQCIHPVTHPYITDTIIGVGMVHGHLVNEFCFLRIFRIGIHLERSRSVEIAIFLQQVLRYLDADFGIYGGDEHRFSSQLVENPFPNLPLFIDKCIIDPEAERQRHTDGRTSQQCIVGRIGKGAFHFGEGIFAGGGFIFIGDFYFLDTGV